MVNNLSSLIIKKGGLIDVGERKVVMAAKDYGRGKPRFIINLPTTRNDLWEYLWRNKISIKVFIEIPEVTDDERSGGRVEE